MRYTSAQIVDELPVLAAIAPYTSNGITIRDARELPRVLHPPRHPLPTLIRPVAPSTW
jgi:hypothetical protein